MVETITIGAYETKRFSIGNGDSFTNKFIDCQEPDATPWFKATGGNWEIRNVGISEKIGPADNLMHVQDDRGGSSIIENVYFGDGSSGPVKTHGTTGVYVNPDHSGDLTIRQFYLGDTTSNAFYGSPPGLSHGAGGTVNYENCYVRDCEIAAYRTCEGYVRNCVAYMTHSPAGRGVWAWQPGPVEVEGCDLATNGYIQSIIAGDGGNPVHTTVHVSNTQYDPPTRENGTARIYWEGGNGTNPDGTRIPSGCPQSAEDAAGGSGGGGGDPEPDPDPLFDEPACIRRVL